MAGARSRPAASALRRFAAAGALTALLGGCAVNPVTGDTDFVTMSEADERRVGEHAHREVLAEYAAYEDSALQAYVAGVGHRVASTGHRPDLAWHFMVLDSPEINAFALPGGYVYITRGLLAYLNSEAELAAVLGHEMGHVAARHAARQQAAAQATGLGVGLLSIFVPQIGPAGRQLANVLGTAVVRGYGRDQELEADRLGAEYLARAGYDPNAMVSLLGVLKEQELLDQRLAQLEGRPVRAYHGLFATHPRNDTRLAEVVGAAGRLAPGQTERNRDRYLDELDGLVFGNNPAGGVVVGTRVLHPVLDFAVTFPEGWRVANEPTRIMAGDPGGFAQLQMALVPAAGLATPEAVLSKLGVREFVSPEAFTAAGAAGLMGYTRMGVQGVPRVVRLAVILREQQAWLFLGMTAREQDLPRQDRHFQAVFRGFRSLSAAERAGIVTRRVRVIRAKGVVTWASLAGASPLGRLAEAELRVLNSAPAAAVIAPGTRLKIID